MLNEGEVKRRNKKEKNKQARTNFPEGQASDDVSPAHNPHGSGGAERGVKKKDRKGVKVMPKYASREAKMEMSHTVYQDMGMLMAESLGLVSEATRKDTYGGTGPDRMAKTPFKRKPEEPRYDSKKKLKSDLASARKEGKSFIGKGDSADNTIIVEPGTPLTPKQKEARKKYQEKVKTDRATARLKHRAKTTGEPQTVIRRKKK